MQTASMRCLPMAAILVAVAQGQSPKAAAPIPQPGVIEGRVVNDKSGDPLPKASIYFRVSGVGPVNVVSGPATYVASTDIEGKFRLENVKPGRYAITAERSGFIRQFNTTPRAVGIASRLITIAVGPGETAKVTDIRMVPMALITGRILDGDGEPLARAQVQALQIKYSYGKRLLAPASTSQTNDLGEYRLTDLPPGRYYVTSNWRAPIAASTANSQTQHEYVATFFPSVLDESLWQLLEVTAGQQLQDVNIKMLKAPVFSVRGKITGDLPPKGVYIRCLPLNQNFYVGLTSPVFSYVRSDGTFEITGVPAGSHVVAAFPMGMTPSLLGKTAIEVMREPVENVVVPVANLTNLSGSIRVVEATEQPSVSNVGPRTHRVSLRQVGGRQFNAHNNFSKADGTWSIDGVGRDKYFFDLTGLESAGYWLKSIRHGNQEVLDTGIDFTSGATMPVEIIFGTGAGAITGKVYDDKDQPAAGSTVAVVPFPLKEGRFDLYRSTTSDASGQFRLAGLPPGEYTLYAWQQIEPDAFMNPEILRHYEGSGKRISMKLKGSEQVDFKVIPIHP